MNDPFPIIPGPGLSKSTPRSKLYQRTDIYQNYRVFLNLLNNSNLNEILGFKGVKFLEVDMYLK